MPKYYIELAYAGINLEDEAAEEALMTSVPSVHWTTVNGETRANVVLKAPTPTAAALRAVTAIREVIPEARVVRVIEDMVSVADIAARTGRTRQHVHQLVNGDRGPGEFPAPRGTISKNQHVWDWAPVAAWFEENYAIESEGYITLTRDQVTDVARVIEVVESAPSAHTLEVNVERPRHPTNWQVAATEEHTEHLTSSDRPAAPWFGLRVTTAA